ncbi:YARHG domain-containing protein [Methylobacterium sp. J-070]|uniref:YARHG domain-containing protein n=1 Tax=Methylobacterium sp. J-070 TaxID=2836650 RepID=UPI001FBB4466|nr:YARHG domain-containing protein [Methylobacterium sp. J-070]MCJ2052022.1 YARHG domain-containing protein [Methylobacterium sp. J-070]
MMKCIARGRMGALVALALVCCGPVSAQIQQETFSYPVGLDPDGDNFLALRSLPSGTEGVRLARLGPDTLFTELGRRGGWVNIRLLSGQTGWVSARYVGCCRTAATAPGLAPSHPPAAASCDDLWYARNAIYKVSGYCFRSPRAVRAFGNDGCQFDQEADVPLSTSQRERLAQIREAERQLGCAP